MQSTAETLIWEYAGSDSSSTEWVDMPTDESLTFVEYQFVSALPFHYNEVQTPTGTLGTETGSMNSAALLPIAVAFPTGITIKQLMDMQSPPTCDAPQKGHGCWKGRRRILFLSLGLVTLILCIISVTLPIVFTLHTSTIVAPFTLNSTDTERYLWATIQDYTDYQAMNYSYSPQRKAWTLLLSDLQNDKSGKLMHDTNRIRQRFAIATVFFLFPKDSWLKSFQHLHECLWIWDHTPQRGVLNCTPSGNITHVNLNSQELWGTLPMEVGMLSFLQNISLAGNNIMGTIPSTFSRLSLLYSMDLSTNSLSGTLPEFISTFSNLHILRFDHNKFKGSLPSSWDAPQLPNLVIFSLSHNALSGSIQPNTWGRFTHLSILDFSFNSFTGITPEGLKYAQNMQSLSINYNAFTGSQDVVCSLSHAVSLTADCLSTKMGITFTTITPAFPCDCCTTCCSKTEGCFPQIGRVTGTDGTST